MTREELRRRVGAEAGRVLAIDATTIHDDDAFVGDLGADSLDLVEILVPIEESLAIDVPQSRLNGIRTFGQLVDVIAEAALQPTSTTSAH